MARFLPLLGDIRGSVGGLQFQGARGGTRVSLRARPVQGRSGYQMGARLDLARRSAEWRTVDAAARRAWAALAQNVIPAGCPLAGGDPSGRRLFVAVRIRQQRSDPSAGLEPPTQILPLDARLYSIDFVYVPGNTYIRYNYWGSGWSAFPHVHCSLYASPPVLPTQEQHGRDLRYLQTKAVTYPNFLDTSPDLYAERFGDFAIGGTLGVFRVFGRIEACLFQAGAMYWGASEVHDCLNG